MASIKLLKSSSLIAALALLFLQFCMINGQYDDEDIPSDKNIPSNSNKRGLIKIWSSIIISLVTFVCGVIPCLIRNKEKFLMSANQFAGGVFLAMSMHFLKDAVETTYDRETGSSFILFSIVSYGYVLSFLVESIVLERKNKNGQILVGNDSTNPTLVKRVAVEVSIFLVLGLVFDSAFDGIGLGLAESKEDARQYILEISIRNVFVALSLGVAVLRMQPRRPFFTSIAFSLAIAISTPIGTIISLISEKGAKNYHSDPFNGAVQGIACGVFLHVSIYHLLAKGFKPQDQNVYISPSCKMLAMFLGVLAMTMGTFVLQLLVSCVTNVIG